MLTLRFVIVAAAVIFTGATETNTELLDATFYGLEEQNESNGPVLIAVVEPSDPGLAAADASQPTRLPDSDVDFAGRRHHGRHHHGRHHHRHEGNNEGRRHHRHHHYGMRGGWSGNWTDEQKMTHICSRLQSRDTLVSSGHATSAPRTDGEQPRNDIHSKLRALDESSRQSIISLWNRRKQEMLRCCSEGTMDAKMQCVNNAKAARYDRVCSGDEPLCPWSALRSSSGRDVATTAATPNSGMESTTSITTRCCAVQGTERVQCFVDAKNTYRQRMQQNPHWSRGSTRDRMDRRRGHHH